MKTIATAALLAATLATAAHAQQTSVDNESDETYSQAQTVAGKPSVTIGGGFDIRPDYSGADTYQTEPVPALAVFKEITPGNMAYIKGFTAGIDHSFDQQLSVGVLANYRYGRDSSDSPRLAGMEDVDSAVEFGPKVRYQLTPQIGLEGRALVDVSDASNGYTARAGADYMLPLSQVTLLSITGGLNYGSSHFNNTYYGVKSFQAKPGRQAYQPGSGLTNLDAGVTLRHSLTRHWSVQGKVGADYLLADVADSPLVDQKFQPALTFGAGYTF